jgi:hypothetical protein
MHLLDEVRDERECVMRVMKRNRGNTNGIYKKKRWGTRCTRAERMGKEARGHVSGHETK